MAQRGPRSREHKLTQRVAELEAALGRARVASDALRRVSVAVGSTRDVDELLELIVDATTEVLSADRTTLYLLRDNMLVSRIKVGDDELKTIRVAPGQGIAGHVAQTGRSGRARRRSPELSGWRPAARVRDLGSRKTGPCRVTVPCTSISSSK